MYNVHIYTVYCNVNWATVVKASVPKRMFIITAQCLGNTDVIIKHNNSKYAWSKDVVFLKFSSKAQPT
jgi:hypothetical protein